MKLRILILLSLAMTSLAFALTPNGKTTLVNGTTYKADDEGATYEITTNGADINAVIDVTANVTIVMNNCHIVANSTLSNRSTPIQISNNTTLELLFKGENKIVANKSNAECSTIYTSLMNSTGGVIFAEAEAGSSLYLRGCSKTSTDQLSLMNNAPVNLRGTGTVLFRSGNITLATPARTLGSTEWISSQVSAKQVSIRGGTLTLQIVAPILTTDLKDSQLVGSRLLNTENAVRTLFACEAFAMTGGVITTEGKTFPTGEEHLGATSKPYDTAYAYAQTHMENLTTATSVSITGGVRRAPNATYFKGFATESDSVLPQACFSETVNNPTVTADGEVKITHIQNKVIDLKYVDDKAKAKVEVLNTPLLPTEQGVDTNVYLGISNITPLIATGECQLELALKIPDDKILTQKTIRVQILATDDKQDAMVVFDGDVTFKRETTESPYFTVTVTCVDSAMRGTLRYTVRAYN